MSAEAGATSPIRVVLADDHDILRQGLKMLLSLQQDIQVVGEARTGRQAVIMVQNLQPDVVVLDISMPDMDGLEACRSEEHTSELQSHSFISYAVFCLK